MKTILGTSQNTLSEDNKQGMFSSQVGNFIAVISAACGNGKQPLCQPDWDVLSQYARSQSLAALFNEGARQYEEFSSWGSYERQRLQAETVACVVGQMRRTQRFLDLYQKLLAAGLRPVVLKGILCRKLYGQMADYRPSCDEDLYLASEQIARAHEVLQQCGWRMTSHPDSLMFPEKLQVIGYEDDSGILPIEVHPTWAGTGSPQQAAKNACFAGAEERAVVVDVEGVSLWSLDATDHYLYLFFHLAKHFENAGVGLRQVLDLAQFQRAYDGQIDWGRVRKEVRSLSSPGLYADVMVLARRFGFQVRELFAPVDPDRLLADCLEGGVFGHDREGAGRGAILSIAARYPTGASRFQRLVLPSVAQLQDGRPWLVSHPWLLPVAWGQRLGRLVFSGKWSRISLCALREAHQRLKLLRQYDLLSEKPVNLCSHQKDGPEANFRTGHANTPEEADPSEEVRT